MIPPEKPPRDARQRTAVTESPRTCDAAGRAAVSWPSSAITSPWTTVVVRVDVDEAWGDERAVRIDRPPRGAEPLADRDDPAARNGDVRAPRRSTCTIDLSVTP